MTKQVRISKVTISENTSDAIITLSNGDELLGTSVYVDWPSADHIPKVTITSEILHGAVKHDGR